MASIGGTAGRLFTKGSVAEQIFVWGVLAGVVEALGEPGLNALRQLALAAAQNTPLSPAELADAVLKGHIPMDRGAGEATLSGLERERFEILVNSLGEPPGLTFLLEANRRGFIPTSGAGAQATSLEQGVVESRLHPKWTDVVKQMSLTPIPVSDAVDAVIEGQIAYQDGEHIAFLGGIKAEDFRILVNTRGRPPSPVELNVLHKRGLIPLEGTGPDVLSVQQGIFEGATKDKWWRAIAALAEYVPPPRTVTALVREGSITDQQALALFQKSGLDQELATAYLHSAHHQKLAASKELAKGDVEQLYRDQLISHEQATAMLGALGFTAQEAAFLLQLQDVKRAVQFLNQAIARVHTLYVNHKLEKSAASTTLDALRVPSSQRDDLLTTWDIERSANLRVLTAAEIASAFNFGVLDQDTAIQELVKIGYVPFDAWVLLSTRKHTRLPNPPAGGLGG